MNRGDLNDLQAFVVIARERSFTKAAAKLGLSQSTLSHTIRELEERLGVRLLSRTTRSVSPTQAGERLLHNIGPRFDEIEAEVSAVSELREKPAGTIRITATENATETILVPKLAPLLREYPDIKVEIVIDYGLTDIVAQQYDAGASRAAASSYRRCPSGREQDARQAYFGEEHGWMDTPVLRRADLDIKSRRVGPLIVEEYDATCLIPPGAHADLDATGNVVIEL